MNLSDQVLEHLCSSLNRPDLSGTRYEVVDLIGRGGMGTVYRARDTQLGREVALKVIEIPAGDAQPVLAEARLLARLEHPGIVAIHDAGILPDGRAYCVMRRVEGKRLDEFLTTVPSLSERLSVFTKLCEAVSFAHSRGVIHRDLKPENIMIGAFGEVIVLDWGAALVAAGRQETGVVVGTSRYMAPEQRRGEQVDCRADIYAIGVLLAQILPSDPPRPLAAIAAKACSPEPEVRYSTADEMAGDVRRYQDGLRVSAYAEGPWEAAARFAVRNRVLLLLLVTYGLVRFMLFFLRPS